LINLSLSLKGLTIHTKLRQGIKNENKKIGIQSIIFQFYLND